MNILQALGISQPAAWERDVGFVPAIETVRIRAEAPNAIEQAAEVLARGGLVALPTDTVYGLAVHAFMPKAIARLYQAKERPEGMPLPLLLADASDMKQVCIEIPALAWQVADRFWPGGLSLILKRAAIVPDEVTSGGPTVAVRVPDDPFVRAVCRFLGAPLASTSANRHGYPAPTTADGAEAELGGRIDLVVDGGPCRQGLASTVLDLSISPPAILRAGPVTREQLATVVVDLH